MTISYNGDDSANFKDGVLNDNNNMFGGGGNDTLRGGSLADTLDGGFGSDNLTGGDGADEIFVGAGNDFDTVSGGSGDDTLDGSYFNYVKHDFFDGGTGDDAIFSNFEVGSSSTVMGGTGDDHITLFFSTDRIDGGAGEDVVDYSLDTFPSSAGINVNLLTGVGAGGQAEGDRYTRIENVVGSNFGDTLTGNGAVNDLQGQNGNDIIAGGSGGDYLNGGSGIDILDYRKSNGAVGVSLLEGIGHDGHAEEDQFFNFENVYGSAFNDKLTGDAGNNSLLGAAGNDVLVGGVGIDTLAGDTGNDTLTGGAGRDILKGGTGADRFVFLNLSESGATSAARDTISDFKHAEGDKIDLAGIDANTDAAGNQAFKFIGAGAFTGVSGQLHAIASGTNTLIEADINGDMTADFMITIAGQVTFVTADFVL